MATVYAAVDLKHDRRVAVKVLRPEASALLGRERFLREIHVVARLTHPHILPLHDSGAAGELLFYVMPLIEGETLRELLRREQQLGVDVAVRIVSQVADALDYAHQNGVVHRDVKPENVLLARDHALVADFGIAHVLDDAAGGQPLTELGLAIGTAAYMSPEQATGHDSVDGRTDVYALGCVLFEMLAGVPPFRGETARAILAARFAGPPPPLEEAVPGAPPHVCHAVGRALAPDPAERFRTASDFARALLPRPRETLDRQDLAILVLPFANVSPDPDREYFSDGLTEELITDLTNVEALRVISRTSSMKLKGTEKRARQLGQELNVRYVLEGSVRRAGNDLRITAALVDTVTEQNVWSDKYAGAVENVFDMQERVSRSIAEALRVRLTGAESRRISQRPIPDIVAYEYYLRAKRGIFSFTPKGLDDALADLERGLAVVGENALLLKGIGIVHIQRLNTGASSDRTLIAQVHEIADRIERIEPASPHAPHLRGLTDIIEGRWKDASRKLRHVYRAEPGDPETMVWLGVLSLCTGQLDTSRALFDRLVAIDPLTGFNHMLLGYLAFFEGRPREGVGPIRRALELDPDTPIIAWAATRIFAAAGETALALEAAERLGREHAGSPFAQAAGFFALALQGRGVDGAALVTEELERWASHDGEWAHFLADTYALAGRKEDAYRWLERAVENEFINHRFLASHDPFLAPLRGEPAFGALVQRAEREWESFEADLRARGLRELAPGSHRAD